MKRCMEKYTQRCAMRVALAINQVRPGVEQSGGKPTAVGVDLRGPPTGVSDAIV